MARHASCAVRHTARWHAFSLPLSLPLSSFYSPSFPFSPPAVHPTPQWSVRETVLSFLGRHYAARMSSLETAAQQSGKPASRKDELAATEFARLVVRTFLIDDNVQRYAMPQRSEGSQATMGLTPAALTPPLLPPARKLKASSSTMCSPWTSLPSSGRTGCTSSPWHPRTRSGARWRAS